MAHSLRQFIAYAREHGLLHAVTKAAGHVWSAVGRRIYRTRMDVLLTKDMREPPKITTEEHLQMEEITTSHLPELAGFIREHNVHPDYAVRRLHYSHSHGYRGFLVRADRQIVGYTWWIDHTMTHPHTRLYRLALRPDEIFGFDLFIAPFYRGRHAAIEFMNKMERRFQQLGYVWATSSVTAENRRSLWVHHLYGFRETEQRKVSFLLSWLLYSRGKWQINDPLWF